MVTASIESTIVAATECSALENRSAIPEPVFYPSKDDEPLAETQEHIWVIVTTLNILSQYFRDRQAVVFADQFFYYIEGKPKARVAPDVMVVFDIPVKMYANYKLWEGGQTPAIIFEITSAGTKERDWGFKKLLYEQIGVLEYWLFDPYGEWIPEQLQGYRLNEDGIYKLITDNCSTVLQLQLQPEGYLIGFYRLDTQERLLTPNELFNLAQEEHQRAIEAEHRAAEEHQRAIEAEHRSLEEKSRADRLAERLRELGVDVV